MAIDESLSAQQRATLRTGAIRALRELQAEDERRTAHDALPSGPMLLSAPQDRAYYHRLLDTLRRTGETIYDWDYDRGPVTRAHPQPPRDGERRVADQLAADIRHLLARIDPSES